MCKYRKTHKTVLTLLFIITYEYTTTVLNTESEKYHSENSWKNKKKLLLERLLHSTSKTHFTGSKTRKNSSYYIQNEKYIIQNTNYKAAFNFNLQKWLLLHILMSRSLPGERNMWKIVILWNYRKNLKTLTV